MGRIGQITVIQGGQYGSESKGMVAEQWAREKRIPNVIRTGSINAGHTVYAADKKKYVFQQLPTASINHGKLGPEAAIHYTPLYRPRVYIGPGAYIHEPTLEAEVRMMEALDPKFKDRLFIDYRATMHTADHMTLAKDAGRHLSMGATGKGCAEVMIQKMAMRGQTPRPALASDRLAGKYNLVDLSSHIDGDILIEGTQGAELDVHLGPYPYVTSRMTSVAAWVAESGLPCVNVKPVLVFRSFPIRVAGNSGPMPQEISWVELAREINRKRQYARLDPIVDESVVNYYESRLDGLSKDYGVDCLNLHKLEGEDRVKHRMALSEAHGAALALLTESEQAELKKFFEFTTVTKKLRRIARFDHDTYLKVCNREEPEAIVFTFMNYLFPNNDTAAMHQWAMERDLNHCSPKFAVSFDPYGYGGLFEQ